MRDSGGSQSLTCVEVVSGRCELTGWPAASLQHTAINTELCANWDSLRQVREDRLPSFKVCVNWVKKKKKKNRSERTNSTCSASVLNHFQTSPLFIYCLYNVLQTVYKALCWNNLDCMFLYFCSLILTHFCTDMHFILVWKSRSCK